MNNWWTKAKEFFSRPKVIKWSIVILSVLIVVGTLKTLVWTIYTKDKPAFVPEEVREDIRGAIKERGESIKKVSKPVGTAIVEAVFTELGSEDDSVPSTTDNWPTYTNAELGISFKYPEGWVVEYQNLDGLSEDTQTLLSLDPVNKDKARAQIFIEVVEGSIASVQDRILGDLIIESTESFVVDGFLGKKYFCTIPTENITGVNGISEDVIVEIGERVYVLTYIKDSTREKDFSSEFSEILNEFRVAK
jgi:hypothetical protein